MLQEYCSATAVPGHAPHWARPLDWPPSLTSDLSLNYWPAQQSPAYTLRRADPDPDLWTDLLALAPHCEFVEWCRFMVDFDTLSGPGLLALVGYHETGFQPCCSAWPLAPCRLGRTAAGACRSLAMGAALWGWSCLWNPQSSENPKFVDNRAENRLGTNPIRTLISAAALLRNKNSLPCTDDFVLTWVLPSLAGAVSPAACLGCWRMALLCSQPVKHTVSPHLVTFLKSTVTLKVLDTGSSSWSAFWEPSTEENPCCSSLSARF